MGICLGTSTPIYVDFVQHLDTIWAIKFNWYCKTKI